MYTVKNQRAIPGMTQPICFQGQWADEEIGLYYNRHRYYDPDMGRYITSDPIGLAGGLNGYGYVVDPIITSDSLGLFKIYGTKLKSGRYTFTIDFHPNEYIGIVTEALPFSPNKNLNRAKKACDVSGICKESPGPVGINEVKGVRNKFQCLEKESELEESYKSQGFKEGIHAGSRITEEQLKGVIKKFKEILTPEESKLYKLDSIVERAKSKSHKVFGAN